MPHDIQIPPGETVARWTFLLTRRQCDLLDRLAEGAGSVDGFNDLDQIMDLLDGLAQQWGPPIQDSPDYG